MARGEATTQAPEGAATETPADATPLTPEQQAEADNKKAQRKARRALRSYVVVPMPQVLKSVFEAEAKAADKPIGPFVRDFLAQIKNIEIPVTQTVRRQKYATDEEREAAKKARRESRSTTMKGLMHTFQTLQKAGVSPEQATAIAGAVMATGKSVEDVAKDLGISLTPATAVPEVNGAIA